MSKKLKVLGVAGGALLLVSLGAGIGGAGQKTAVSEATPTPVPTVTVTAKPEVKTVTVTVEKTPPSCLAALGIAGEGTELMSQVLDLAASSILAASTGDLVTLNANTAQINERSAKMDGITTRMRVQIADCRSKQ